MIKILFSEDQGLLDFSIRKLNNKHLFNIDGSLENLVDAVIQTSIFDDVPKNWIIKDAKFLTTDQLFKKESVHFENLLKNSKDNNIFFIVQSKKLTNETLVTKNSEVEVINFKKLSHWNIKKYIESVLSFLKISLESSHIDFLAQNFSLDSNLIFNELCKVKNFNESQINHKSFLENLNFGEDKNVFEIIEYFLNRDSKSLVKYLNSLEDDPIKYYELFNIFVSQLFTLKLFVKSYAKTPNFFMISKHLDTPLFQVEKWKKLIVSIQIDKLEILLYNLFKIEKEIMIGNTTIVDSIKLFLLGEQN